MRAVIYDSEGYEPLTVIEVPEAFIREIETGVRSPTLRVPIFREVSPRVMSEAPSSTAAFPCVTIRLEPIYKGGKRVLWLCTTSDSESASLLRATFLPGQRGEVFRQTQEAFLSGLSALMGPL